MHYSKEFKEMIENEYKKGLSVKRLSKEYKVSRYAIQSWCGLRPEVNIRQEIPLRKGRPRKSADMTPKGLELENKRLTMENELLRDFLRIAGRR